MPKIHDALFQVPSTIPYSMPVRYWGEGMLVGLVTPLVVYPAVLAAAWAVPGHDLIPYARALKESAKGLFYALSGGTTFAQSFEPFMLDFAAGNTLGMGVRVAVAAGATCYLTYKATKSALTPRTNVKHVSGPRLLEGDEAMAEARRRSPLPKEAEKDPFSLFLHPDLLLSKKDWSRHMFIYGSVGSGKSVILKYVMKQVIKKKLKCFIYDVKGDFTSIFRPPIIVCPFDRRSYVWDVACDVRTLTQATEFARSLIPPEPNASSSYWSDAPREILIGLIVELQIEKPRAWGFTDLSQMLLRSAMEMEAKLEKYYPQAVRYIKGGDDNVTVQGVLSGMASRVKFVHDLARAWPKVKKKRRFAITEWVKDDYQGRNQIIVQAGPDKGLTAAYISALVNIASTDIISPALPDNEEGRFLGFILDEMSSVGKLNVESLVDKGRSKGVVCVFAVQDLVNQLGPIYTKEGINALAGMVGSHVICQTQMGDTRDALAEKLGKRKIAWFAHGTKDSAIHEENKSLVSSPQLTDDLGFRKGKRYGPNGWGIRAIVQTKGDPLLLNWPGENHPIVRIGQEQAEWVTQDTSLDSITKKAPIQLDPNDLLSSDEMKAPMDEEEALWLKQQIQEQHPHVLDPNAPSIVQRKYEQSLDQLMTVLPPLNEAAQEGMEERMKTLQKRAEIIEQYGSLESYNAMQIERHLKGSTEDDDPFGLLSPDSVIEEPEEATEDDEGEDVEVGQAGQLTPPKFTITDIDSLLNQAKRQR